MGQLYHLIYLSRLAPDTTASCVAGIVRAARLRNKMAQIGSLLVFDGARFCQYLEGTAATVQGLADRIQMDARHTDFRVIHESGFDGPRLLPECGLEYALSYGNQLDDLDPSLGPASYTLFRTLIPGLDLTPGRDPEAF